MASAVTQRWVLCCMNKKTNTGFIWIPVLIISSVIILGGVGYFGFNQYRNYQHQKIAEEKQLKDLQDLASKHQDEINKLSEKDKKHKEADLFKNDTSTKSIPKKEIRLYSDTPENKVIPRQTIIALPQGNPEPSITDYAGFIVRIICLDGSGGVMSGSGTIFGLNKFVLTNSHVVEGMVLCNIGLTDDVKKSPTRWYEAEITSNILNLDIASLRPLQPLPDSVNAVAYNFCHPDGIKLGDPIIVLGYPSVGGNTITATEGVISGFEGFMIKTSAKIEHGNSGGGAFLKDQGCWFGIPTSVMQGELESLGRIINYSLIHQKAYE